MRKRDSNRQTASRKKDNKTKISLLLMLQVTPPTFPAPFECHCTVPLPLLSRRQFRVSEESDLEKQSGQYQAEAPPRAVCCATPQSTGEKQTTPSGAQSRALSKSLQAFLFSAKEAASRHKAGPAKANPSCNALVSKP